MRHLLLSGSVHEAQTEEGRLKEDLRRQKIPLVQLQSVSTVKIPLVQLECRYSLFYLLTFQIIAIAWLIPAQNHLPWT